MEDQNVLTKELMEANKAKMAQAREALTPPEGKVLVGMRAFCPIHGDITNASRILKYTRYMKNEESGKVEPVSYSTVLCLACLSDLWNKYTTEHFPKDENGNVQPVQVAPIFLDKEEAEKLSKEEEKVEEEKKE